MDNVDLSQATVLAGVLMANIGALVTFFVNLKVDAAVQKNEIKHLKEAQKNSTEDLKKDIKNLGNLYRSIIQNKEE